MLKKISFSLLLQTFIGLLAIGQTVNYKLISLEEPNKVKEDFSDFLPLTLTPLTTEKPIHSKLSTGLEIGLKGGLFQILGEIKRGSPNTVGGFSNYGFAGSLRFALDNIFSLRAEFLSAKAAGNSDGLNPSLRGFTSTWMSGSMWGLINLHSLASAGKEKKFGINLMVGAGANSSTVKKYGTLVSRPTESETSTRKFDISNNPFHAGLGLNLSYRVSSNLSIGLEHQTMMAIGERRDLMDGWDNGLENPTSSQPDYNDFIGFTNLNLNYRFGKKIDYSKTNLIELLNSVINEMRFPLINDN